VIIKDKVFYAYVSGIWEWLRSQKIFDAIPIPAFSAAAELASLKHPRRSTLWIFLQGQKAKAKSSKVASSIPKYLFYQGRRVTSLCILILKREIFFEEAHG
jgi:hypothetical protein